MDVIDVLSSYQSKNKSLKVKNKYEVHINQNFISIYKT